MSKAPPERSIAAVTQAELPRILRHALHDLAQPLQAARMILEIPGVVADDERGLPRRIAAAMDELDVRVGRMQELARILSAVSTEAPREMRFSELAATAARLYPDVWRDGEGIRLVSPAARLRLPPRAATAALAALIDNARHARPRRHILAGVCGGGRWIVVADAGDGMAADRRDALAAALAGEGEADLGVGLALARLAVASWGGRWRLASREGRGSRIGFSIQAGA